VSHEGSLNCMLDLPRYSNRSREAQLMRITNLTGDFAALTPGGVGDPAAATRLTSWQRLRRVIFAAWPIALSPASSSPPQLG